MTLADAASSMAGLLVIFGLIGFVIAVWAAVMWFRFMSAGRKAFDRYLRQTDDQPHRSVPPHLPTDPPSSPHTTWRTKGSQM